MPIMVQPIGASIFSASARTSAPALSVMAPPPMYRYGFFAARIISIACSISHASGEGTTSFATGACAVYSYSAFCTSFGMSTKTGPGLPDFAIWNAPRMVSARSSTCFTRKLCLVIGMVTPVISTSWKLSLPIREFGTFPVIATSGTESRYAVAIPVTRLVAPGPEVAMTTPTFPVARA